MECQEKFERIPKENTCQGCCRQQNNSSAYCLDCKKWLQKYPKEWINHHALFAYNEWAKTVLKQYKYQGDYALAHGWGSILKQFLKKQYKGFAVCPIPSSDKHFQKRGFIPTECILETGGISYVLLLRHIGISSQANKNRQERLRSRQPFQLIEGISIPKKLILIDDVYTTGRTLLFAKELLGPHTEQIKSLSIFR